MLLNHSNHPSAKWLPEQLEAAKKQFGGAVQDLPFPNVPPTADEQTVVQMVEENLITILDMKPTAVHLMGEMTYLFRMVKRLKELGIPVVASTTERNVIEEKNGKKTLIFKFVQFRAY